MAQIRINCYVKYNLIANLYGHITYVGPKLRLHAMQKIIIALFYFIYLFIHSTIFLAFGSLKFLGSLLQYVNAVP